MHRVKHILQRLLQAVGIVALVMLVLAFTDLPYLAYHQLGTSCKPLTRNPDVIVVFGASGMPSPDGLMRTYYAAEAATRYPEAWVTVAHPYGTDTTDTEQLEMMAFELTLHGVERGRILFEPHGHNTRTQSIQINKMFGNNSDINMLVVTSPEHMYRAIRSLKKAGLKNVGGLPSFEKPITEKRLFGRKQEEKTVTYPFRYNVWSYLKYELLVLREYCAIAYYKLNGWI